MLKPESWSLDDAKAAVGKWWHKLLEEVYVELNKYSNFRIVQVKEKWGKLRIYFDPIDQAIFLEQEDQLWIKFWDYLAKIEKRSGSICEDCGEKGSLVKIGSWLKTHCEPCSRK